MKSQTPRRDPIDSLFRPKSVAIVGASDGDPWKAAIVRNAAGLGYSGAIYPINPRRKTVASLPCYPSLDALPEVPDAVIVAVPAERVRDVVADAARLGVGACVVFTGGFADIGPDGVPAQQEIARIAADSGMALIGPNCQGAISFAEKSSLYLQPVSAAPYRAGRLALVSHSGSLTDALVNNEQGVGWSHVVSVGNEAVTTAGELLAYLIEQESCDGVCLFLETIRDAETFFAACDRARELNKPVIVLKTGRTAKAAAAAAAHTGALATPDRLMDAAFRAHRVARVSSIEEMLCAAAIVQAGRVPQGNGVAAVAGSGGLLEMLYDAGGDIRFPELTEQTMAELDRSTGPWVHVKNPIDYWPTDDLLQNYPRILQALAADPAIDTLVEVTQYALTPTDPPSVVGDFADAMAATAEQTDKALVVCAPVFGEIPGADIVRRAADRGLAIVGGIDRTLHAIGALARNDPMSQVTVATQRPVFTPLAALSEGSGGSFAGLDALDVMRHAGFDVVETVVAPYAEAALSAAEDIGYPVTLKVAAADIHHKTEVGGVVVGVPEAGALREVVETFPRGEVLVQSTVSPPMAELILGLTTDPVLGRFIVVGMGGVWTEILDDAVACPVGKVDAVVAEDMLRRLAGYPTLAGARGQTPLAVSRATEAIVLLDALARSAPLLTEIDLNPLILTADRAVVVDALVTRASSSTHQTLPEATP